MAFYRFRVLIVILIAISILWQLVEAQQLKTVIAGESVEFSCTLSESLPPGDVSWEIQWESASTPLVIDAEATLPHSGSQFGDNHGEYRTVYRSKRGIRFTHYCTLIIETIQLDDAGRFSCKHVGNFRDRGIFSEHELRVLPRPPYGSLPRCSQALISASANSPQEDMIELQCEFSGGNPPAKLIWYKNGIQLGPIKENSNDLIYRLQPSDNGVEFSCHAMSPALSETSYCHLTPLVIQPSAYLEPSRVEATSGADVTFICSGQGVPSISRIDWYVDGDLQGGESSRGVIQANLKTSNTSHLTIHDLQDSDNEMDVMCEVATASGLTADSLARVRMLTTNVPTDVRASLPAIDLTTQATKLLTEALSVGMTTAFDTMNSSRTTYNKSTTESGKTGASQTTTLGYRRVEIGAKVDNNNQNPSQKSKKSNIPATATAIGLICFIIIVVIVVVVKRRRSQSLKDMQAVPSSPTDSIPNNPLSNLNEYANQMYEGTIYNTSATKASENFYQSAPSPTEEDPGKTWSTHEGCGIWQDDKNHHYENTAIGSPFPTFARQNAPPAEMESEETDHILYDIVERNGNNPIY